MAKVRVRWRPAVFREVRTLPRVQDEIAARTERVASAAGEGYVTDFGVTGGRGRSRGVVITGTAEAMVDNARHHTLLRALDEGRG